MLSYFTRLTQQIPRNITTENASTGVTVVRMKANSQAEGHCQADPNDVTIRLA